MKQIKFSVIAVLLASISACSDISSEDHVNNATKYLQDKDIPSAVIELKNAIRKDSANVQARLKLAEIYESVGDLSSAEKEFEATLRLSPDHIEDVAIPLAKTLYLQKKNDKLAEFVQEHSKTSPETYSALLVYSALAKFDEDEKGDASGLIEQALTTLEDSNYTQLGLAMQASKDNNFKHALEISTKLIEVETSLPEVWLLHGQLLLITNDTENAEIAFNKYVELLPQFDQAKIYYAYALLKNQKYVETEKLAKKLLKIFPEQSLVNQLYGFSKFHQSEFEEAFLYIAKAIQLGQRSPSNLLAAGISAFRLEKYEQAYNYFQPIKKQISDNEQMKRIVSFVEIKLGYYSDAADTISEVENLTEFELDVLTTASFSLARSGKTDYAAKTVDILNSASSLTPEMLTKRGLLKLTLDDVSGVSDLEQALSEKDMDLVTKKSLLTTYLQQGQIEKLLALAKTLQQENSDIAFGYIAEALGQIELNNVKQAHQLFEHALTIEPNNIEANLYLAHQHFQNIHFDKAIKHIENIRKEKPNYTPALSLWFLIEDSRGNGEKVANTIGSLADSSPDMALKFVAARILFTVNQYEKSNALLTPLSFSPFAKSVDYWLLKLAVNHFLPSNKQEKDLFQLWMDATPNSPIPWVLKAQFLEVSRKYRLALQLLDEATGRFPSEQRLSLLKAQLLLLVGKQDIAKYTFSLLSEEQQTSPFGQSLQGQFEFAAGQYNKALTTLTKSYQLMPQSRTALTIMQTYRKLKQEKLGISFLDKHVRTHPRDEVVSMALAEILLQENEAAALSLYKRVTVLNPNNFTAFNNVAYMLKEVGQLQEADEFAEGALKLAPQNVNVLDTALSIKLELGSYKKAIEILESMYEITQDIQYKTQADELQSKV